MHKLENCALCGKEPAWDDFNIECGIGGERAYSCCGIRCCDSTTWNRVQAALRAERELEELKNICRDSVKLLHSPFDGRMDRLEEKAELLQHLHRLILCGGEGD